MEPKEKKCTILVCSSDGYEDAWYPFFKLFTVYWSKCSYEIILNTESKVYKYEDLDIQCYQFYKKGEKPAYGERMIRHLQKINTPYTLILMDDFFLRRPVDEDKIDQVIQWLDKDENAVVFSFQNVKDKLNICSEKYPQYLKRPVYGEYKFNFQAAIWRTEKLLGFWKKHETPWEWETIGNIRSFDEKLDFYVLEGANNSPIDYGFDEKGMGIFRGKWVIDTVKELFENHDIYVDYSVRGIYTKEDKNKVRMVTQNGGLYQEKRFLKSVGIKKFIEIELWRVIRFLKKSKGQTVAKDYIEYKREKESSKKERRKYNV